MKLACLLIALVAVDPPAETTLRIGSKAFSESVILGELLAVRGRQLGYEVRHRRELGGTGLVWKALLSGDIDVYPDYTGTIAESILRDPQLRDEAAIRERLAQDGIRMSRPLGFENAYALGMREATAERIGIRRISDLRDHPKLAFGFGNEFMDRDDGWPSLQRTYELPQINVRGLDHMLAYRALRSGDIQVMDVYTTDANIQTYEIRTLEDDLRHFPKYDAVVLYRADLEDRAPRFVAAIRELEGHVSRDDMLAMNVAVDVRQEDEARTAANFLFEKFGVGEVVAPPSESERWAEFARRMAKYTAQHLFLVVVSLGAAIVVAVPLGVVAAKKPALGQVILSVTEIVQTIPGLALLIFLMTPVSWFGLSSIGPAPAIVALFLYSLLPVIRNTYTGIRDIPNAMRESATAMGLTPWARLSQVELPMASRLILAGIKTTAVINVGYATLGGLIGAGGYGELIMQGLRRSSELKMLEGAVPAAIMALVVKWLFEWSERWLVPRGLRLKSTN